MSVTYAPYNYADIFTIGGSIATGPFPKYSISKENIQGSDGSPLSVKYNINITGTVLTPSSGDITVLGDMQSKLQLQIINKLQIDLVSSHHVGLLTIEAYGGLANQIVFADAKLISIEIPEQTDESAGILYSGYNFTFEATVDSSNSGVFPFPHNLKTAEETWQIALDQEATYSNFTAATNPVATYTITHTVSASANKKFTTGGFVRSSWKEAAEWVKTRLVDSPGTVILSDAVGTVVTSFTPSLFDEATTSVPTSVDLSGHSYYNHLRVPTVDLLGGSYSVTETWKASEKLFVLDLNIELSEDDTALTTVNLSGSITGLTGKDVDDAVIDGITNAEAAFAALDAGTVAFDYCNNYYVSSSGYSLNNIVKSKSVGRNKATSTITFSYSYNDNPIILTGARNTSLKITDDNELRDIQTIAIIDIIGKATGPVIQNMSTTPRRSRSFQLDALMAKESRTTKPSTAARALLSGYIPTDGKTQNFIETWDPYSGAYSLSVDWTY